MGFLEARSRLIKQTRESLGLWARVLDLLQVAGRAGVLLPFTGLEVAVRTLLLLARQARGRAVGPCFLPLGVHEEVQRLGSPAGLAGGAGPGGLAEGVQVQLAAEPLEQLRDALVGRAALVEPGREGAQDQHVLAAADAAGDHGAVGDVGPAVDVEVQQHRASSSGPGSIVSPPPFHLPKIPQNPKPETQAKNPKPRQGKG